MLQFLTYTAYGVLGVVSVGLEESVCWWCVAVQTHCKLSYLYFPVSLISQVLIYYQYENPFYSILIPDSFQNVILNFILHTVLEKGDVTKQGQDMFRPVRLIIWHHFKPQTF